MRYGTQGTTGTGSTFYAESVRGTVLQVHPIILSKKSFCDNCELRFFSSKKISVKLFLLLNRSLNLGGPIMSHFYFNLAFKEIL